LKSCYQLNLDVRTSAHIVPTGWSERHIQVLLKT